MVAMYRGCCVASICLAKAELWNQGCVGGGEATERRCVNCERFVEAGGVGRGLLEKKWRTKAVKDCTINNFCTVLLML